MNESIFFRIIDNALKRDYAKLTLYVLKACKELFPNRKFSDEDIMKVIHDYLNPKEGHFAVQDDKKKG